MKRPPPPPPTTPLHLQGDSLGALAKRSRTKNFRYRYLVSVGLINPVSVSVEILVSVHHYKKHLNEELKLFHGIKDELVVEDDIILRG